MELLERFKQLYEIHSVYLALQENETTQDKILNKVIDIKELEKWIDDTRKEIIEQIPHLSVEDLCKMLNVDDLHDDESKIYHDAITMLEQNVKSKYNTDEIHDLLKIMPAQSWIDLDSSSVGKMNILSELIKKDESILLKFDVMKTLIKNIDRFVLFATGYRYYSYEIASVVKALHFLKEIVVKSKVSVLYSNLSEQTSFLFAETRSGPNLVPSLIKLCHPNQSLDVLIPVADLIASILKCEKRDESIPKMLFQSLAFLFTYNHNELRIHTMNAYGYILKRNSKLKIDDFNVKIDKEIVTKSKNRSSRDGLIISGYVRNWGVIKEKPKWSDIMSFRRINWGQIDDDNEESEEETDLEKKPNIPFAISKLIERYFCLSAHQSNLNDNNHDILKKIVSLVCCKNCYIQDVAVW
eukprot:160243_1